ncbi:hypothetical protein [Gemella morbillorum]
MKEVKWFKEVVKREENKTRSFEKSRDYLQWLIDKYNESPFELNVNKLNNYEKECLFKGLKLRGYNEETIKLLFK